MKKLELETSKGKFVVVDLPKEVKSIQDSYCDAILTTLHDGYIETYYPYEGNQAQELKLICKLADITEEQASEVVDWNEEKGYYYKYPSLEWEGDDVTAIESLHSLIESKGVHLYQNPYGVWYSNFENANKELDWQFAEQKTFYKPHLIRVL